MARLAVWQKDYLQGLRAMRNVELLDEVLELNRGDDYDGGLTRRGTWCLSQASQVFAARLEASGYLTVIEAKTFRESLRG